MRREGMGYTIRKKIYVISQFQKWYTERGWTGFQAAKNLKVDPSYLYRIERAQQKPSDKIIDKIIILVNNYKPIFP
jgi:transcriptional regulator with XRE-family HTH domain